MIAALFNISFSKARRLSSGLLLAITVATALASLLTLRHVAHRLEYDYMVQVQKSDALMQVPLLFAEVGVKIHAHDTRLRPNQAELIRPLDEVRVCLQKLKQLPLSEPETQGLEQVIQEEKCFRTAVYAFTARAGRDPSGDYLSQTLSQINRILAASIYRSQELYQPIAQDLRQSSQRLLQSMERIQTALSIATTTAVTLALLASIYLGHTLSRPISAILHATRQIGAGHLAYRINSPFTDIVGQLAQGVDEMANRLMVAERQTHETLEKLQAAKALADSHAATLAVKADELLAARDAAEAANIAKNTFLANMSHEIRTPMTAILGYADLLASPTQSPSERLENIQTIQRNGKHLLVIINDILDLSKIEAGKMEVERINCSIIEIVADVASLMRGRAREVNLALDVEYCGPIPQSIQTDPLRLRQILVNLVGNAVKFTPSGSVRIVVRLPDPSVASLEVAVVDTGIGMSRDQISRLFQPFSQADESTTRRFGGTGLGLAIASRLAQLLGGKISVESTPGKGSLLRLTIATGSLAGVALIQGNTETISVNPTRENKAQPTRLAGKVLLAEDGPDNQRLISFHLRSAGAQVTVAENGQLAVDLAIAAAQSGEAFGVILMDMQMPVMDGYGATQLLRERGYRGQIVALTAHAMDGDRGKCLRSGCNDYVTKPIDRVQLINTVHNHLLAAQAELAAGSPPATSGSSSATDERADAA